MGECKDGKGGSAGFLPPTVQEELANVPQALSSNILFKMCQYVLFLFNSILTGSILKMLACVKCQNSGMWYRTRMVCQQLNSHLHENVHKIPPGNAEESYASAVHASKDDSEVHLKIYSTWSAAA